MDVKPEYRDRPDAEVAVLEALAERAEEGMTVFEIRSRTEIGIDRLETALADLKADDLIDATETDDRTIIVPDDAVLGAEAQDQSESLIDRLRHRLGL